MGEPKEVESYYLRYPDGTITELPFDESIGRIGLKPGEQYYIVTNRYGHVDHGEETGVMDKTHDWRVHSNGLVQCKNCGACPCHSHHKTMMDCEFIGRGND